MPHSQGLSNNLYLPNTQETGRNLFQNQGTKKNSKGESQKLNLGALGSQTQWPTS